MKLEGLSAASIALIVALVVGSATPAAGQNSVTNWSNAHYDVVGSSPGQDDEGCIMNSTFEIEGRSSVKFSVLWDGESATLALTSYDWSAVRGQEYSGFSYYFPDSETLYDGGVTRGFVEGYINKGFITQFPAEFLDRLAAENRLFVTREIEGREDLVVVADLYLVGSSDAVAALKRCATHVVAREEARRRRESHSDYIERDPFAD